MIRHSQAVSGTARVAGRRSSSSASSASASAVAVVAARRPRATAAAHRPRCARCSCASSSSSDHQQQSNNQQQQSVVVVDQPSSGSSSTSNSEDAYNAQMQKQMGWEDPFSYHYDRGLYYHQVYPRLLVGTQPRNPAEVEQLAAAGVGAIVDLQRDEDKAYWGVDGAANAAKAAELGLSVARPSITDFSADSLRHRLPDAVRALARALDATAASGKKVYVHCTAGLGRAPALAIAYLYWLADAPKYNALDDAYNAVTSVRPCGPRKDAIRAATADVMRGGQDLGFERRPSHAYAYLNDDDRAHMRRQLLG